MDRGTLEYLMFSPSLALGLFYVIVGASMQRMTLADLRRYLRHTRRQLSAASRRQAGRQVADQLRRHPNIQAAQHIGIYLDDFGEVPTSALILQLLAQGKTVYLPVIRPFDQRLVFVPICMQQYQQRRFYRHRLGMLEPRGQRGRLVAQLDVLIMPLVAVDQRGIRLGMGGGFYDRTLAHAPARPYRIGLAYPFQQLALLPARPWDQALDAVVTPELITYF